MEKILVNLNKNTYPIYFGNSIIKNLKQLLEKHGLSQNIFFIIDKNLEKYWGKRLNQELFYKNKKKFTYILSPGENSKNYLEVNKIYSSLLENNFGRDTLIVACGGGVSGDLAGFVASTFMRGLKLVHIPTSLLAMVDSSIGGKTGINFQKNKNLIGTFYQPDFVLIDTAFLTTLPKSEILSGMGEIIKYGFLSDQAFFSYLDQNFNHLIDCDLKYINYAIFKSVLIKASVVSDDEKEEGLRQILNLGHTFAHAFEKELNFKIKHGEAVAAGIICAVILSYNLNLLPKNLMMKMLTLASKIKLPKNLAEINLENVLLHMLHDKKNRNGKIKFVLLKGIGEIIIGAEASKKEVISALSKGISAFY